MKKIVSFLIFILLFFTSKELIYFIVDLNLGENKSFLGQPKDWIMVQVIIFLMSVLITFYYYLLNTVFNYKNEWLKKVVGFFLLPFAQVAILSIVFYLRRVGNELYVFSNEIKINLILSGLFYLITIVLILLFTVKRRRISKK